jgi:nucleoside-diphosphate-sugar epimerase
VEDWLYSKDNAKACVLACFAEKGKIRSRVYNVCEGIPYSFQDLVNIAKKAFPGVEIRVREISKQGMAGLPLSQIGYDISKARDELGFEPDFNLESAFTDYSQWLRRHWPSGL